MDFIVRNGVQRLPSGAQPPYAFYVDVLDRHGQAAFRESNEGVYRKQVLDWCNKNCSMPALIGGFEMVCFGCEEDALLFYLSFKK